MERSREFELSNTIAAVSHLRLLARRLLTSIRNRGVQPSRSDLVFWSSFVKPGDLVYDVGANVGDKAAVFVELGANVVAFEPQPKCSAILRRRFAGRQGQVRVVPVGLADHVGELDLSVCSTATTISSFDAGWTQGRFSNYDWDETIRVAVTTLENCFIDYGTPAFAKIDVEGFEPSVIKGLRSPISCLSFEFTFEFLSRTDECISHLESLGYEEFNFACGEERRLRLPDWISGDEIGIRLRLLDQLAWGDVYARHRGALRPN